MNIRVRGRAKVGLLAAFAAAIANLRAGDRWGTQVAGVRKLNEAITGASGRRAQRRRHTPRPARRAGPGPPGTTCTNPPGRTSAPQARKKAPEHHALEGLLAYR